MDQQTFTSRVRARSEIALDDHLHGGIRAALTTLAERITPGEAEHLGAQLPPELGGAVAAAAEGPVVFDRSEMLRRVQARSGLDPHGAEKMTAAVFSTLSDAVTAGEIDDVSAQLPDDIRSLFDQT